MKETQEEEDKITSLIGNFGRWQAMLFFPLGLHFVFGSFQTLVTPFLSLEGDYFCQIEAPNGVFQSLSQWRNFSNPSENGTVDKCNIYELDYASLNKISMEEGKPAEDYATNGALTTKNCTAFEFETKDFESSIVTDFSLVCGNNWQVTLAQSLYMLGIFIGASLSGIVSDKVGRKKTIIMAAVLMSIFSTAVAFADTMITFVILRMFTAFASVSFFTTFFVYAMEMVGGHWKTFCGIGFEFPWALAYSLLPAIGYYERNWRNLQLIISVPPTILIFAYYFMPESPRWLITQGRVEEAKVILQKAAKTNGKVWPSEDSNLQLDERKENDDGASVTQASILALFRTPNLLKNTLIQYFNWFTASFVYYALTFNSGTLFPGNIYINTLISGLIEFPAYALCIALLYFLGRRFPLAFMYFLLGGSLLLSLAMPTPQSVLVMATIGKFGAVCAFAIIYVQAAEIFPTVVRNTGIGTSSSIARVGSVLAPIVGREVAKINRDLVIVIFAVVALISGALTLFLPETNGKKLPDTIEEGEAFGKGESAFDVCCKRKKSTSSSGDEIGMENAAYNTKE